MRNKLFWRHTSEVICVIATRMHHRRKLATQPKKALVRARRSTHETCEKMSEINQNKIRCESGMKIL